MINIKKNLNRGFTLVELLIAIGISIVLTGAIFLAFSEANFYLRKQMYRDNVQKYADAVMNDIFSSSINASFVNVENSDEITLGYRTNNENIDSIKVYQHRPNQGILVDGKPLKNAFFHNKDQNSSYYMYLKEFRADHTLDGQGYNSDVRDVVVDIFLGIELFYKRGNLIIREEFPYKKTIFTRYAAVYNASKEFDE